MTFKTRLLRAVVTLTWMGPVHASEGAFPQDDLKQQLIATYGPAMPPEIVPYVQKLLTGVPRDCFQAGEIIQAATPLAPWQLGFVIEGPFEVFPKDAEAPNLWLRIEALKELKDIPQDAFPALNALIKDVEGSDIVVRMMASPLCRSQEALNQIVGAELDPFCRSVILCTHQSFTAEQILLLKTLVSGTSWCCAQDICRAVVHNTPERTKHIAESGLPPKLRRLAFEPYVTFTKEQIPLLGQIVSDIQDDVMAERLLSFAYTADEEDLLFVLDADFCPPHRRSALCFVKSLLPQNALFLKRLLTDIHCEDDAHALFDAAASLPQEPKSFITWVRFIHSAAFEPPHRGAALKHVQRLTQDNIPFVKACLDDVAYVIDAEPIVDAAISLPQDQRAFILEGQFARILRAAAMKHHAKLTPAHRPFLETLLKGVAYHFETEAIVGAALALNVEHLSLLVEAAFEPGHRATILAHGARVTPAHIPLLKTLLTGFYSSDTVKAIVETAVALSPEQIQITLGAGFKKDHLSAALTVAPHLTSVKIALLKELMEDVQWSAQEVIIHGAPLDEEDLKRIKDAGFLPSFRKDALKVGRDLTDQKLRFLRELLTDVTSDWDIRRLIEAAASLPVWQLEYTLKIPCPPYDRADFVEAVKDLTQDKTVYVASLLTDIENPSDIARAATQIDTEHLGVIAQADFDPDLRLAALEVAHHVTPEKIQPLKDLFANKLSGWKTLSAFRALASLSPERLTFLDAQRFNPDFLRPVAKRAKWLRDEDILALKNFTADESINKEVREAVITTSPLLSAPAYAPLRILLSGLSYEEGLSLLNVSIGKTQDALTHAATLAPDVRAPYLNNQPRAVEWHFAHMGKVTRWDRHGIAPELSAHMSVSDQSKQDIITRAYTQMTHPDPVTAKRTQQFVRKNYEELGWKQAYQEIKELQRLGTDFESRIQDAKNPDHVRTLLLGEDGRPSLLPDTALTPLLLVGGYLGGVPQNTAGTSPVSSLS